VAREAQTDRLQPAALRCPRCGGLLADASARYTEARALYKDKKHCLLCGRDWQLVRKNGKGYAMERFPFVVEWEDREK